MKYTRSAHRLRLGALLALVAAMALGSFWVLEIMHSGVNDALPSIASNEPDYYVEKFTFVKVSKTGEVRYHISGEKLTHNPQDSSYDIVQPAVRADSAKQAPMTIRANRAHAEQAGSKVHMHDNVQIDRPASGTKQHFHLTSDYLLVLPDIDVMQTDKPVDIKFGSTKLTGTGLYANQATGEFTLADNVHGTYQPARPQ